MSQGFIGEIRWFTYLNGVPSGWLACDGRLLSISAFGVLYGAIGTTYGGDATTTFAVPDLRGRVPVHQGTGPSTGEHAMGEAAGSETVALTTTQMPPHYHFLQASNVAGTSNSPAQHVPAQLPPGTLMYVNNPSALGSGAPRSDFIGSVGSGSGHENRAPTLALRPGICYSGTFPPRP